MARQKLAALEHAEDALLFSSGSAAVAAAVISFTKADDHVVCVHKPYNWTKKLLSELLVRFGRADCHGRTGTFDCSAMDWFLDRARALGVEHAPPAPLLLGRHLLALGVTPGPRMGEILRAVYEKQLDGAVTTVDEAVAEARHLVNG